MLNLELFFTSKCRGLGSKELNKSSLVVVLFFEDECCNFEVVMDSIPRNGLSACG